MKRRGQRGGASDRLRAPSPGANGRCEAAACAARITTVQPAIELGAWVTGFVVAEGCFTGAADGTRFTFAVGLGATDAGMCEMLLAFFGVGTITGWPRRKEHYDDEVTFGVRSIPELLDVIVPFMDEHLPPSYKRTQYEAWRAQLADYWEHRAKRVRPCTVEGCDTPLITLPAS